MTTTIKYYPFNEAFAEKLATALCVCPKVWAVIGTEINAARLQNKIHSLMVRAASAHAKQSGSGCNSAPAILQRLTTWADEGKVTQEEINAVATVLVDNLQISDEQDAIITEVVPIIRKDLEFQATEAAIIEFGKNRDFTHVVQTLERAKNLGTEKYTASVVAGFEDIDQVDNYEKLPTGIVPLDIAMQGGLRRGCLGMVGGAAKVGKSKRLMQQAIVSMRKRHFVALITLELTPRDQNLRMMGNITGVPTELIANGKAREKARAIWEQVKHEYGPMRIAKFEPKETTINDIADWIKTVEVEQGRAVDSLIVDYGDLLGSTNKKSQSAYDIQGDAYQQLREYVEQKNIWCWTASQLKRGEKDRNIPTINDFADSQNKVRVVDLVTATWLSGLNEWSEVLIANRHSSTRDVIAGPFPVDLECGRLFDPETIV